MKKIKVALEVLGCKVNQSEGESILSKFKNNIYEKVSFKNYSDIYIIHTCTVTSKADSKSRKLIRKAKKQNKKSLVVVTGCYAQVDFKNLSKMNEIDLIIGTKEKNNIVEIIENFNRDKKKVLVSNLKKEQKFKKLPFVSNNKTRAFIKIQEGCDRFCSYCIIPIARGPSRSNSIKNIIKETISLLNQGYKEIVLTGIHIGLYGKDLGNNINLNTLINELILLKKLKRIRFGSLDPNEIDDEFIELFKNNKILPHIHISLQSGNNIILKKMNRNYNIESFAKLTSKIISVKKTLLITTDIIVGFPYETEEFHKNSINFIKKSNINKLHVFKYSMRRGTKAAYLNNQIPEEIKNIRAKEMNNLSKNLYYNFLSKMLYKKTKVLIENVVNNNSWGYSENYIKVLILNKSLKNNKIYTIYLQNIKNNYLIGKVEVNL